MLYIDFGAHRGIKAAAYAKRSIMTEAILYEPNPAIEVAEIPGVKTQIHRLAAWDRNGVEPFYIGRADDATGSSLIWAKTTGKIDREHPFEVLTFDAAQMLLDTPVFPDTPIEIKMNIEGAEYRVFDRMQALRTLELKFEIRAIHLSLHSKKLGKYFGCVDDALVIGYLKANGFQEIIESPFGDGFRTWRR